MIKEVLQAIQAATGGDSELYDINPDVLTEKFKSEGFTTIDQVSQISTNVLKVVGFPLVLEEMLQDHAAQLALLAEGAGVSQPCSSWLVKIVFNLHHQNLFYYLCQ